jgi:hypothetical protein
LRCSPIGVVPTKTGDWRLIDWFIGV